MARKDLGNIEGDSRRLKTCWGHQHDHIIEWIFFTTPFHVYHPQFLNRLHCKSIAMMETDKLMSTTHGKVKAVPDIPDLYEVVNVTVLSDVHDVSGFNLTSDMPAAHDGTVVGDFHVGADDPDVHAPDAHDATISVGSSKGYEMSKRSSVPSSSYPKPARRNLDNTHSGDPDLVHVSDLGLCHIYIGLDDDPERRRSRSRDRRSRSRNRGSRSRDRRSRSCSYRKSR